MDDHQLVNRVLNGDRAAADHLVLRFQYKIKGVLFSFRDLRSEADDLFQEVFARVFADECRALRQWRGDPLHAYLANIARNVARDRYRALQRIPDDELPEGLEDIPSSADTPEQHALILSLRQVMRNAISELTDLQQTAIHLTYLQGRTNTEAAERVGIDRNSFNQRLRDARIALKRVIRSKYPALLEYLPQFGIGDDDGDEDHD